MPDFYLQPQKPDNNNIIWKIILGIIVLILLLFTYNVKNKFISTLLPEIHKCNWEDCDHQGEIKNQYAFISKWGYEEMTDRYLVELTHFLNPSWEYEECEDYIFDNK